MCAHAVFPAQCPSAAILNQRINAIIDLIPDDFPGKDGTVRELRGRQDSIPFTAPSAMAGRWFEVSRVLVTNLPDPETADWVRHVRDIFSAEF